MRADAPPKSATKKTKRKLPIRRGAAVALLVAMTLNFAALDIADAAPPTNLVVNPYLGKGTAPRPTCFSLTGWGERSVKYSLGTDVPPNSPRGTRSFDLTIRNYKSGDAKLLQSQAAGCAPTVKPGMEYLAAVSYKSNVPASMTVFTHTKDGWAYWTDVKTVPATAGWQRAEALLPKVPAGVDRLSFGLSLSRNGALSTTAFSLTEKEEEEPPPVRDPSVVGKWNVLARPMPLRAVHTTLLSDGRVLLVAGSGNSGAQFDAGEFTASVWDPVKNTFLDIDVPIDMFCAGHVTLPDGKVLISGGTQAFPGAGDGPTTFEGTDKSYYFDPKTNKFHPTNDMIDGHWYPTLTKLGNGDVWAAGGLDEEAKGTVITERFDYSAMSWLPQSQVPQTFSYWGTYPHMYLLDDGMMFYSGSHTFGNNRPGTGASIYDADIPFDPKDPGKAIKDVPGLREKDMRDQAGSVLLPPAQDQKVMVAGGGHTEQNAPAINLVDIIDLKQPAPRYRPGPSFPGPGKAYVNMVNLPNRTVLAANGATYNRAGDVKTAALYKPSKDTQGEWLQIDSDPVGRNYHSTSILLADGRVAVFGSNPLDNSFDLRISIYEPPYLFKAGGGRSVRPAIGAVPSASRFKYGQKFNLPVSGDVATASLTSPMSATHQTDTNARLVDLPISGTGGTRSAQIPDNPNLLPPGPYMLNVLSSKNIPSVSKWVWIS